MLVAMAMAAGLCIFNGSFPATLDSLLPYEVDYTPYTLTHIVAQTQLLVFSALAFTVLMLARVYPPELRSVNLDVDCLYRFGSRFLFRVADRGLNGINTACDRLIVQGIVPFLADAVYYGPGRFLGFLITPYWRMRGLTGEEIEESRCQLYQQVRLGIFPIGITVYLVVLVLVILFFLEFV
jgi:multicomponent Na+:H+ antiporter subunit D